MGLAEAALAQEERLVRRFTNPELAWNAFAMESHRVTLLLTDYAMPGMDGLELATRCRGLNPELKVVLTSGTLSQDCLANGPVKLDAFLPKPYTPSGLRQLMDELLK